MNQFLITQNVKSVSQYLDSYEKHKDEVREIILKYGHKILKILVLNDYKTVKTHGVRIHKLPQDLINVLKSFKKISKSKAKNGILRIAFYL